MMMGSPTGISALVGSHHVKFHKLGKLMLKGRNYLVPYKIDADQLLSQLEPIEEGLEHINTLYTEMQVNLAFHTNKKALQEDHQLANLLPPSFTEHISYLIADVHLHKANIRNYLDTLVTVSDPGPVASNQSHTARNRRGLINAGGELLSYAFGLTTDQQMGEASRRISSLEDLTSVLSERSLVHQEILNTSLIHIDLLTRQQDQITSCLHNIQGNFMRFINVSETRYSDIVHLLTLVNSLSYISSGLADLTSTFNSFRLGMEVMKRGNMAPALLPEHTVLQIVQTITKKNLKPLFPGIRKYLKFYYANTKVISMLEPTEFVLSFPLLSEPDITFDLYKVISLPHPLPQGRIITYRKIPPYFAISKDWSFQFELQTLDPCKQYHDLFLCEVYFPIKKGTRNSCVAQLFHQEATTPACSKLISSIPDTTFFTKADHGWFYASTEKMSLSVNCPERSTERVTLQIGVGKLNFTNNCLISSTQFVLPAMVDVFGPPMNHTNEIIPFQLSLEIPETQAIKLLDNEPILTDLLEAVGGSLPLKALQSELGKLPDIRKVRQINTYTSTSSLIVGVVCLILILLALALAYYVFRVCSNYKNTNYQLTVNPVADNVLG